MNITLNYRLVDNFLQWNTTKRNRIVNKNELRISALPIAIAFEQTSTSQSTSAYNHHKITYKCNINSGPHTRLTCIDSHSSSKLVSTDGRKCKLSYISQSRINYFNDDFSVCYYALKLFLVAIKHRFNGLFAYIIILTMAFISAIIILMDVFKYGFNIGFVRKSRQRSKQKYRANYSKEHQLTIIRRCTFTNISKLQTIPDEDEVQS